MAPFSFLIKEGGEMLWIIEGYRSLQGPQILRSLKFGSMQKWHLCKSF